MSAIAEREFAHIVDGIVEDREKIIRHNPIGTDEEILLWMLLSCLVSYLSLEEVETPCFTGRPDAETYSKAISFILAERRLEPFDIEPYLLKLTKSLK